MEHEYGSVHYSEDHLRHEVNGFREDVDPEEKDNSKDIEEDLRPLVDSSGGVCVPSHWESV